VSPWLGFADNAFVIMGIGIAGSIQENLKTVEAM